MSASKRARRRKRPALRRKRRALRVRAIKEACDAFERPERNIVKKLDELLDT